MTRNSQRSFWFVALLTFAGLVSGMLTGVLCDRPLDYNLDTWFGAISLGAPFGAIVGLCLAVTGAMRNILNLVCFCALVTCTLFPSVFLAEGLEIGAAAHGIGSADINHSMALFAGGMVGGFIILGAALYLSQSKMRLRAITHEVPRWSLLSGVLAPVAWASGPWVGMWVWSALHAVGLTRPGDTLSVVRYEEIGLGELNRLFALFAVWQTGTGFALGILLRGVRETPTSKEVKLI